MRRPLITPLESACGVLFGGFLFGLATGLFVVALVTVDSSESANGWDYLFLLLAAVSYMTGTIVTSWAWESISASMPKERWLNHKVSREELQASYKIDDVSSRPKNGEEI